MGAEKEHKDQNWIRETKHAVHAKVMSFLLNPAHWQNRPNALRDIKQIVPLAHQGWCNYTLLVTTSDGKRLVMRLQARPRHVQSVKWSVYHKEEWAIRQVASRVPIARVVEDGVGYFEVLDPFTKNSRQYAFMLQEYLPYPSARALAISPHSLELLRKLGKIARDIHAVTANGIGKDFDADSNRFRYGTWAEYLDACLAGCRLAELATLKFLSVKTCRMVEERLLRLKQLRFKATLCHRDFLSNFGNVLIDAAGDVRAIIDWEFCSCAPAFEYEIAAARYTMLRDGESEELIESKLAAVLDGYGMREDEFEACHRETVEDLVLLNSLSAINKYIDLKKRGGVSSEPWRRTFAERAQVWIETRRHTLQRRASQLPLAA
ncbi:MAG: aminoglycoside phosphotransferase family protein [Deltaproteobacteria bacterium]|nr:aminoglycoside phosphotransferase family protein [Deltaproteobacteria bacterium]